MHDFKPFFLTSFALSMALLANSPGHLGPTALGEPHEAPPIEREQFLPPEDAIAFDYKDSRFFVEMNVVDDSVELKFLAPEGRVLYTMTSEPGEGFETPVLFRYHGEGYLYVSTTPSGSGGFVTETIFWIAPDSSLHPVGFEQASQVIENQLDGETVLTGGPGIIFSEKGLEFEFYIARPEDPHCCPTGGTITGSYRIVGGKHYDPATKQYSCTFRIVPDEFHEASFITAASGRGTVE